MIPFGNETVTLVQRVETVSQGKTTVSYTSAKLNGCSWRRTTHFVRDNNAIIPEESIICRVPADQTRPKAGDLMILGSQTVNVTSGADFQQLIETYRGSDGAFVVSSVADNARPDMPMPHYAARG